MIEHDSPSGGAAGLESGLTRPAGPPAAKRVELFAALVRVKADPDTVPARTAAAIRCRRFGAPDCRKGLRFHDLRHS